ncbi:hypothetical protein BC834DRAFT_968094 [Gloeopeniophorella convolvens]|nr:hypothetical protein BC834DRAFT_968094 [Gloeopeniophorella convolvens]
MKRIRQAYKFVTGNPASKETTSFPVATGGELHDQWAIPEGLFLIDPKLKGKGVDRSALRHSKSMPFPARGPRSASAKLPVDPGSHRPEPVTRFIAKDSKLMQILGPTSDGSLGAVIPDQVTHFEGVTSPPLLPMEIDPFASGPMKVPGNIAPPHLAPASHAASQRQRQHAPQLPSQVQAPSVHTAHGHAKHSHMGSPHHRAPRSRSRGAHTGTGDTHARSYSNPPLPPPLPVTYVTAQARPPLIHYRTVNNASADKLDEDLVPTEKPVDSIGPRVRGAASQPRQLRRGFDPAPTPVPRLRKAHSSTALHAPPLLIFAPKPVNPLRAARVDMLLDSVRPADSPTAPTGDRAAASPQKREMWPPNPLIRPLHTILPLEVELAQHAQKVKAEAEQRERQLRHEQARLESTRRGRDDRGNSRSRDAPNEERRAAERSSERRRPRHHHRAATERSRKHGREVEYLSLADHGYQSFGQGWVGPGR